jgi:DNA processing protein
VQAIPFDHPLYPVQLRQIHEPPLILFVKGEFNEFSTHNVLSVVGTRNPSSYGQRVGKEFGRELSAKGAVVCSGMAIGIDSLAHWGAIEGGGKTIAVVATGPDICYPSSNKKLYKTILEGHGSIVSEYFPGTTPEKWHFPERNRIIAGLSSGVLVVEAGDRSGALLTAEQAFNDSRRVFAIPGRIDSQMSIGTNRLIARNVAMLVTSVDMIFEELNWVPTQYKDVRTVVELFGREKEVFDILTYEPVHFDMLCDRANMEAGELSATLTMLELAGIVQRHPGEWYSKINQGWVQQKPTSR